MTEAIIVGLIAAIASIIAAALSAKQTQNKIQQDLETSDAVQNEKIEQLRKEQAQLRKEVEKHNNYGVRIPVIEEQIKVANHRIDDLERKVG